MEGEAEEGEKSKDQTRPEIPERAQRFGKTKEENRRTREGCKERVEAQLSVAHAAGKDRQRHGEEEYVKRVQHVREGAAALSLHTQRAQQVIAEGKKRSEQERTGKGACLRGDLYAHV